jgi:hypothetical protein
MGVRGWPIGCDKPVLATPPELPVQSVEFAREHRRVTMGGASRLTGGSRNTLRLHWAAVSRFLEGLVRSICAVV